MEISHTIGVGCNTGDGLDPVIDATGSPIQQRGVTACPGLYLLRLHWIQTFRSAILPFVGRDTSYLADHIEHLAF
jgi:putative flavoprotein involved in K+ transport